IGLHLSTPAVAGDQHLAESAPVRGPYDPAILHLVEHAGRPRVADPQPSLQQGRGGLVIAAHDVDCLAQQRIGPGVIRAVTRLSPTPSVPAPGGHPPAATLPA